MSSPPPAHILEWDSEHWGINIARVCEGEFTSELEAELDRWTKANGTQLLSYLCDAADSNSLLRAQSAGFAVVDVRVELSVDIVSSSIASGPAGLTIRPATPDDLVELRAIASVVHSGTRFAVDPRLRPRAGALYERWIERDVLSTGLALAAIAREEVVGYLTATVDSQVGAISLVGVKEAARGRGAGRTLIETALRWFHAEGCATASVVTSAAALNAQRLYHRAGFRPSACGLWLHRWAVDAASAR